MYQELSNIQLDYLFIKATRNLKIPCEDEAWKKLERRLTNMTELYIKNMICKSCIYVVSLELKKRGFKIIEVDYGVARIEESLDERSRAKLSVRLQQYDLELSADPAKDRLIDTIKNVVIKRVFSSEPLPAKVNWPNLIMEHVSEKYAYSYLSLLFSTLEKITLEQYIIQQKIQRVKELLLESNLSLIEIAKSLGYASVQHLSAQFKQKTGLTPSRFKAKRLIVLDLSLAQRTKQK